MAAILVIGVTVSDAQATTVSKPDITATVTATVSPTRLPAQGAAPVTLTVAGTFSRPDPTALSPLRSINLLLDRQLTVTTAGLPVCPLGKVHGAFVAEARKDCGPALIGSGTVNETFRFPAGSPIPPYERHYGLLLFNGQRGVLLYSYVKNPAPGETPASVNSIGRPRRLSIRMGPGLGSTVSFRFRLGRTWRDDDKQRSYLSGRCKSGALSNPITLSFADGDVTEAEAQRCTKAG